MDNLPKRINKTMDQFMHSFSRLLNDPPIRNFIQSLDDLATSSFPFTQVNLRMDETEQAYIIKAKLPQQVNKEQIDMQFLNNTLFLTIKYQEIIEQINDKEQYFTKQQTYQSYRQVITFPSPVLENESKATFKNNYLHITIPKAKGKRISIKDDNSH
ncbi:Hsp20/alpha crystallin family protein [Bacillus salinus]|uniref:Hsp20/alpha crystallin family protein n=1 Tax=Bacillus sp. HMF5848 TaxID=2495421 RepID=UPI00163AC348|nr:Hsp20/alpha crystallin family protein [Bacillus sp. HMF5848]